MFDFFDSLEKKKAFKKALEEVREENNLQSKTGVSRVYSNENYESVQSQKRYTGSFSKPATGVVDLKHFKDWRKVDKVQSNNPVYDSTMFKSSLTKNEPEIEQKKPEQKKVEQPESKKVEPVFKSSPVSKYVSSSLDDEKDSFDDFDDFFKKNTKIVEPEKEKKKTPSYQFNEAEVAKAKSTFARMFEDIEKKRKANEEKNAPAPVKPQENKEEEEEKEDFILARKKQEPEKTNPEVKIHVVDDKPTLRAEPRPNNEKPKVLVSATPNANTIDIKIHTVSEPARTKTTESATKPAVKKTINRKPRGKNKRRFDADVIGSVDWR